VIGPTHQLTHPKLRELIRKDCSTRRTLGLGRHEPVFFLLGVSCRMNEVIHHLPTPDAGGQRCCGDQSRITFIMFGRGASARTIGQVRSARGCVARSVSAPHVRLAACAQCGEVRRLPGRGSPTRVQHCAMVRTIAPGSVITRGVGRRYLPRANGAPKRCWRIATCAHSDP